MAKLIKRLTDHQKQALAQMVYSQETHGSCVTPSENQITGKRITKATISVLVDKWLVKLDEYGRGHVTIKGMSVKNAGTLRGF